jgi:hypothetical protein
MDSTRDFSQSGEAPDASAHALAQKLVAVVTTARRIASEEQSRSSGLQDQAETSSGHSAEAIIESSLAELWESERAAFPNLLETLLALLTT